MCEKYFDGKIPVVSWPQQPAQEPNEELGKLRSYLKLMGIVLVLPDEITRSMEILAFQEALAYIWSVINGANKYIEETAPWKLSKEGKDEELKIVITALMEVLRAISQAIWPFMPSTGEGIWKQLGLKGAPDSAPFEGKWGFFYKGGDQK